MFEVLGEDHGHSQQDQADDEKVELGLKHVAKGFGKGNLEDAVRTAGEVPVGECDPGHLTEAQRHDREVVAAQAQGWIAEDGAGRACEEHCQRDSREKVPVGLGHQQGAGVGADREKGRVAQVEQPGEPDHDVQPQPEHGVGGDADHHRGEVLVPVHVGDGTHDQQKGDHARPVRDAVNSVQPLGETGVFAIEPIRQHANEGQGEEDHEDGQHQLVCCHMRSATRSPKSPVGLTTRTVIRTPKTITSSHLPDRYPVV